MKINTMFVISLAMFGLSAASFLAMRIYQSHMAALFAAGFGFAAMVFMMIPGLQKLLRGKTVKPKV
ncbi:MAG TPA: hypothetical protein VFP45_01750 [Candidatus Nitrosotalea sp.]|nr:hypothetical protein [Candidatus Nitrosotalea sp.]